MRLAEFAHTNKAAVLAEAPQINIPPSGADAVNAALANGIEGSLHAGPGLLVLSLAVSTGYAVSDHLRGKGSLNKIALRSCVPDVDDEKKQRISKPRRAVAAFAAATVAGTATAGLGFVFSLERAVRTGQERVLNRIVNDAGLKSGDLMVTQGGVDTPMDDSFVPKPVAAEVGGVGFDKILPKAVAVKTGEKMDGLLFSLPTIDSGVVVASGLTGLDKTDDDNRVRLNGVEVSIDGDNVDDDLAAMRRDIFLTSPNVASQIKHQTDDDGNYFGVIVQKEDGNSQEGVQRELDNEHGEGAYSVLTVEEFMQGTESFMLNNGTAVLMIAGLALAAAGAIPMASGLRRRVLENQGNIAVFKALGGTSQDAVRPHIQSAYAGLVASMPVAWGMATAAGVGANAINPGLGMSVTPRDAVTALVVVGGPAIARGAQAGFKIAKRAKVA